MFFKIGVKISAKIRVIFMEIGDRHLIVDISKDISNINCLRLLVN